VVASVKNGYITKIFVIGSVQLICGDKFEGMKKFLSLDSFSYFGEGKLMRLCSRLHLIGLCTGTGSEKLKKLKGLQKHWLQM
jgi:hypothetical protein